ncbi:MAG: DinB family protein [Pseudomonadota bacterium]|nr:DinB family protein [Pseudomonadota bacterium]
MNTRLHDALARLDDAERKQERGAYFGSIHETCNHLLWGDRIWLARFTGAPFGVANFGRGMYGDFEALRRERGETDDRMIEWSRAVDEHRLAGTLRYTAAVDGRERTLPFAVAVVHFFNHGTHHRGQLTTLMTQAGLDPGVTDLPWLPPVESEATQSTRV